MKILLADSDRDLLNSYQRLLRLNGHEVGEAFDGTRVYSLLREEKWDILLLEDGLPRVGRSDLTALARENDVPVIVLIREGLSVRRLLAEDLPEAYLPLPFLPEDLTGLIENVLDKKKSEGGFPCGELVVDLAGFCLRKWNDNESGERNGAAKSGTLPRLTCQEIDLLAGLNAEREIHGKRARTMILALNEKLSRAGAKAKIAYEYGKGYRLVSEAGERK